MDRVVGGVNSRYYGKRVPEYSMNGSTDQNCHTYKTARNHVLKRDESGCRICERKGKYKSVWGSLKVWSKGIQLHIHHILFKQHGGSNHPRNLITLCEDCHKSIHRWEISIPPSGAETKEDYNNLRARQLEQSKRVQQEMERQRDRAINGKRYRFEEIEKQRAELNALLDTMKENNEILENKFEELAENERKNAEIRWVIWFNAEFPLFVYESYYHETAKDMAQPGKISLGWTPDPDPEDITKPSEPPKELYA